MIGKRYFCFEPSQLVSGALLVPSKISPDCLLSIVNLYVFVISVSYSYC